MDEAREWLNDNRTVVARQVLTGYGGAGIVVVPPGQELPPAPLYTKYVSKMSEFRVHCVGDEIIDVQRKAARRDVPPDRINWQVRNHGNGFIYVRGDVKAPRDVLDQALAAFRHTRLDFGAVDVLWNQKGQKAYVLEINTAPGLEGQTLTNYSNALRRRADALLHL
jgi:hypothetical protein